MRRSAVGRGAGALAPLARHGTRTGRKVWRRVTSMWAAALVALLGITLGTILQKRRASQ